MKESGILLISVDKGVEELGKSVGDFIKANKFNIHTTYAKQHSISIQEKNE
jgi:hypothetical protein